MMTFEERKQECINRGIVPGAVVECAMGDGSIATAWIVEHWQSGLDPRDVIIGRDASGGGVFGYEAITDRYARVIIPAPAEPSEVDRLRERVKELEAQLREVVDFCDDPNGSEQRETLAEGLSRMLPNCRALLTTNNPDQP